MNDPHVESLRYRLELAETLEFQDPPPLEQENDELRLRLAEGVLTVWPKKHFPSEEDATGAVEPYLRSWEIFEAISRSGRQELRFEFESAKVIDRDPPPPGAEQVVRLPTIVRERALYPPTFVSLEPCYPKPPEGFAVSYEVEFMWGRYERYLQGREPLLAMAYVCLTLLEHSVRHEPGKGPDREKAVRKYGVDKKVLDRLGHLTSILGDETEVRKVDSKNRPPTDEERRWIERCVLDLIRRVGEHNANSQ